MGRPRKPIEVGTRFNRLVFLRHSDEKHDRTKAWFRCDCGNVKLIDVSNVRHGAIKSCGCMGAGYHEPMSEEEKERIKQMYRNGMSTRAIGLQLGRDTQTINKVVGKPPKQTAKVIEGMFDWKNYKDIFQII